MTIFGRILADISVGQLREVRRLHNPNQTHAEYEARIFGKAASLFAGCAEIAATLCDESVEVVSSLRLYGKSFGMALQIIDDVLDIEADLQAGVVALPILLCNYSGVSVGMGGHGWMTDEDLFQGGEDLAGLLTQRGDVAPAASRKVPLIFCRTLIMRRSRSA